MADLTATLLACQNPDPAIRSQAEAALTNHENSNFPSFLHALASELQSETKDPAIRQLAGLHFKNLLTAKDSTRRQTRIDKYKSLPTEQRSPIKQLLLQTLHSGVKVARHTTAQACAEVAAIELPHNEWPEFLPFLMESVTSENCNDDIKTSALECLGFTCERLATGDDITQDITDKMLTTIVDGIRPDRPDQIRLAAATALRNSLLFTRSNMEKPQERNVIMQNICEATQCATSALLRAAAYECIVQICFQYYDKLKDYMQTLFQLTFATIKNDEEVVALQAMEFWSTLCEEEMEILDEILDATERGIPPERECVGYVRAALDHLIPLLSETLTRQDETADIDDDTWSISVAGATCLSLVANTVEDAIVPVIMPFVQSNIRNPEWRFREASIMAFSSILEGPSGETIGVYVNQSIPVLLECLADKNTLVKDTTAWALGRICEYHARSIPPETFPQLVQGLMAVLTSESSRVASQACFALHNLAAAFAGDETGSATGTNALSPYMPQLLQTLLQAADRENSDESNLRVTSFEAVNVLIQYSAPDCKPLLLQLLPAIVERLALSFNIAVLTNEDRDRKETVQGLLCGVIQVICLKLEKEEITPYADAIMQNLLQVLQAKNAAAHEEAFLVVGAIADKLERDFEKYMSALQPFLMMGLQNFEAYRVCIVAVGVVGDISRAVESVLAPYCDDIMGALMQALQNQELHRSVKPPVLSCFGDIALAIGAQYEKYLQVSLMMLMQASQTRAPEDDEELVEYVNTLREGILEAYTGIIQGMKDGGRVEVLVPYVDAIFRFLEMLSNDGNHDIPVLGRAIGLIGDLASSMGPRTTPFLTNPYVQALFQEGLSSGDGSVMDTTNWASSVVREVLSPAS
mmetsp:Transcript_47014/g.56853  ORF Transcript_47014/g.56853 Transcript_47014/m.56853 type:complete len:869 (-) Transcript_47014:375-2981(-)